MTELKEKREVFQKASDALYAAQVVFDAAHPDLVAARDAGRRLGPFTFTAYYDAIGNDPAMVAALAAFNAAFIASIPDEATDR